MYDILSSRSKAKLLSMVNERLADGWKLVGGHTHVVYEEEVDSYESEPILRTTGCWSQAMEFSIKVGYTRFGVITKLYDTSFIFKVERDGGISFNVIATHRATGRESAVNTVNEILSLFMIDESDKRFEQESDWEIEKSELGWFMSVARDIEPSPNEGWLDIALDKDRSLGGWNSGSGWHL